MTATVGDVCGWMVTDFSLIPIPLLITQISILWLVGFFFFFFGGELSHALLQKLSFVSFYVRGWYLHEPSPIYLCTKVTTLSTTYEGIAYALCNPQPPPSPPSSSEVLLLPFYENT
jgi:hypothetical protein